MKFERLLETYMAFALKVSNRLLIDANLVKGKIISKKFLFENLKQHDEKFQDINKIKFSDIITATPLVHFILHLLKRLNFNFRWSR